MRKSIMIMMLVVLLTGVALADASYDFSIASSIFNKDVLSSKVWNDDSVTYGGVYVSDSNLQNSDSVTFTIVNTSHTAISNGVRYTNSSSSQMYLYYYTDMTYWNIYVKLRGRFSPRSYEAYARGIWAP